MSISSNARQRYFLKNKRSLLASGETDDYGSQILVSISTFRGNHLFLHRIWDKKLLGNLGKVQVEIKRGVYWESWAQYPEECTRRRFSPIFVLNEWGGSDGTIIDNYRCRKQHQTFLTGQGLRTTLDALPCQPGHVTIAVASQVCEK